MGRCLPYFAACMPICSWIFWRSFRVSRMTRRQFIRRALFWSALSNRMVANAATISLRCTPAPSFPVPLSEGIWRSQEFPVGKHDYHVWLDVDRRMPLEELDCDLGPPRQANSATHRPCSTWNGGFGMERRWLRIGQPSRSELTLGVKDQPVAFLVISRARGMVISSSN